MSELPLTPEQLLTTTRSVRKRLDLERPVERELIVECMRIAQQAPTGGNREGWQFVFVTDAEQRRAIGEIYRRSLDIAYGGHPGRSPEAMREIAERNRADQSVEAYLRVLDSVAYLYDHIDEVPVLIVPCVPALADDVPGRGFMSATRWGSVIQGVWSFMLAARSRGLGTAWTTASLQLEAEVASVLEISHKDFMQAGLMPLAYTKGTSFKPGPRGPVEDIIHWNRW